MPSWPTLGEWEHFAPWTRRPKPWGPDGRWSATFGGGVLDDLVAGIGAHAEANHVHGAAVGCVFLLTSRPLVEALLRLNAQCVVVDKGSVSPAARSLHAHGSGVWQSGLPGLSEMAPADAQGRPPVIGPYGSPEEMPGEQPIGPVRLAGFGGTDGRPLLHAKVLVLGSEQTDHVRLDDFGYESFRGPVFQPTRVWVGSANWTEASRRHLEFGAWTDDPQLCAAALGFVGAVVRFSEPIGSASHGPAPELVRAEWDDEAFREALREYEWAAAEAAAIAEEEAAAEQGNEDPV